MQATVTDRQPDIAVLHLSGELDADTAETLTDALDGLVGRAAPHIVVDLSDLRFCDSTGLSAFVGAHVMADAAGGWLRLAGPNAFLRKLIETVGLTRYIGLYADIDSAVSG
jgi:anti-sigma B factor antagonist